MPCFACYRGYMTGGIMWGDWGIHLSVCDSDVTVQRDQQKQNNPLHHLALLHISLSCTMTGLDLWL